MRPHGLQRSKEELKWVTEDENAQGGSVDDGEIRIRGEKMISTPIMLGKNRV